jgi:hypothetical protein
MKANVSTQLEAWRLLSDVPIIQKLASSGVTLEFKDLSYGQDPTARFECTALRDELTDAELREIKKACTNELTFEKASYSATKTAIGRSIQKAVNSPNRATVHIDFRIRHFLKCETITAPEDDSVTDEQMDLLRKKFIAGEVALETCTYDRVGDALRCDHDGCADSASIEGRCYGHYAQAQDTKAASAE